MSTSNLWATFHVGDELFGLPVADVSEVLLPQRLTPVPRAPQHVAGLLHLRGEIMPALDLRVMCGANGDKPYAHLLVVTTAHYPVAVLVDDIGDVLDLPGTWHPPPGSVTERHHGLVRGIYPIGTQLVLGLRVEALADEDDRTNPEA